jgi:hypothetical protein
LYILSRDLAAGSVCRIIEMKQKLINSEKKFTMIMVEHNEPHYDDVVNIC